MPATEQTWRSTRLLHIVFALTSIIMLVATIWMFASDHDREWKDYQMTMRDADLQLTQWQKLQYETDDLIREHERLQEALIEMRARGISDTDLQRFKLEVIQDHRMQGTAEGDNLDVSTSSGDESVLVEQYASMFSDLDALTTELRQESEEAVAARRELNETLLEIDENRSQADAAQERIAELEAEAEKAEAKKTEAEEAEGDAAAALEAQIADLEEQAAQYVARAESLQATVEEIREATLEAEQEASEVRGRVLDNLATFIERARFREDLKLQDRKFKGADLDAAKANLGLGVRDELDPQEMEQLQAEVDVLQVEYDRLTAEYQDASAHRRALEEIVRELREAESELEKQIDKNQEDLQRLQQSYEQRRSNFFEPYGYVYLPGKKWLELPILDAFNSPLKIENLWSEGLTQDYNFREVRRFDRCTTCHQASQKTQSGSATEPAYPSQKPVELLLAVPRAAEGEPRLKVDLSNDLAEQLETYYGIKLADTGLIDPNDVTVSYVRPSTVSAEAELEVAEFMHEKRLGNELKQWPLEPTVHNPLLNDPTAPNPGFYVGDVIAEINGDITSDPLDVTYRLLQAIESGQTEPFKITVHRGLPHPYASHPRLDLFVGSLSPHKMSTFACTICHEGQGSATAFKWASHTPNSPEEMESWQREHGWFDNHHWIYPMNATRYVESGCLKCHHEVTELEQSSNFEDTPAPKVTHGFHLIRKYGCYGCHEINGYDGQRRIGPDMRLEPNYFAAAAQLMAAPGYDKLDADTQEQVQHLVYNPTDDDVRHAVLRTLLSEEAAEVPRISPEALATLRPLFQDVEHPGELRKAGPSTRFIASKLDDAFLYDWIRKPSHFRPSTRMPQFFGLWDHLDPESLELSKKFEPIEILSVVTYLKQNSQPFEYIEPPEGISESTPEEMAERGKWLFQSRGCLACHSHEEFPEVADFRKPDQIQQAPDLSGVGDKFDPERNPNGPKWLYTWIRAPSVYHPRTVMPDSMLDPIVEKDTEGNVVAVTDPVADIVAYLLTSHRDWEPATDTITSLEDRGEILDELAMTFLSDAFYERTARKYLQTGIPEAVRDTLKGAEKELIVSDEQMEAGEPLSAEQKLLYVGRKTISKYGCYGCHDIPGFEEAKPIGTGLADWGRKESSKLAFEHIHQYLHAGHGSEHGHHESDTAGDMHLAEMDPAAAAAASDVEVDPLTDDMPLHDEQDSLTAENPLAPVDDSDAYADYYHLQLNSGNRVGFIYQKLLEPRSYDYLKTKNKKYHERLRMPLFPFDEGEREAVITFVLGLVASPPSDSYVYSPDPHEKALIEGRQVLEKFNCGGCHILETEKWKIGYEPGKYGEERVGEPTYPFVLRATPDEVLEAQAKPDRRDLLHSIVEGMPTIGDDGKPVVRDPYGDELFEVDPGDDPYPEDFYDPTRLLYSLDLWKPAVIDGSTYQPAARIDVAADAQERRYPVDGGDLTRYLLPHVVEREKEVNPNAKGSEALGWLPPPLHEEGWKVQTDWLHSFLLDPYTIRPAVVLRMPKFNMSAEEATKLVNYFAAKDNVPFPYTFAERKRLSHLMEAAAEYEQEVENPERSRFGDAMNIVTNNNYCVKCHIVGDFVPSSSERAKAPDLAEVYKRLRPDYLRQWIAKPTSILPYTSMPVNIPFNPDQERLGTKIPQDVYHGNSVEQVDALVDLLMNYDLYSKQRAEIAPLVEANAQPVEGSDAPAATPSASPAPATPAPATPAPADAEPSEDAPSEDAPSEDANGAGETAGEDAENAVQENATVETASTQEE